MKRQFGLILLVLALVALAASAEAHTSYTGYSGAPGSSGRCASSCHGGGGGTIEVSGFPAEYIPGDVYTVTISHAAGVAIRQFNGSCRIGTGSANAGVIAAGTNTATYSTGNETNGIRWIMQNTNSGDFQWTAPASGTGEVRLYVAGLQGSYGGQNTTITLVATEQTVDVPASEDVAGFALDANFPNPFADRTTIGYLLGKPSSVVLEIFDVAGRRIDGWEGNQSAGYHQFTWDATGVPSGTYFYRLQAESFVETKRMELTR